MALMLHTPLGLLQLGVAFVYFHRPVPSLRADTSGLHLRHMGAKVNLGFPVEALGFQGPVVNPRFMPSTFKAMIRRIGPSLPPFLHQLLPVPIPVLVAEAFWREFARREQDMGVGVITLHIVKSHVGHHAAVHELLLHKSAGKFLPLLVLQFLG
jgi:hypothetical protein